MKIQWYLLLLNLKKKENNFYEWKSVFVMRYLKAYSDDFFIQITFDVESHKSTSMQQ